MHLQVVGARIRAVQEAALFPWCCRFVPHAHEADLGARCVRGGGGQRDEGALSGRVDHTGGRRNARQKDSREPARTEQKRRRVGEGERRAAVASNVKPP